MPRAGLAMNGPGRAVASAQDDWRSPGLAWPLSRCLAGTTDEAGGEDCKLQASALTAVNKTKLWLVGQGAAQTYGHHQAGHPRKPMMRSWEAPGLGGKASRECSEVNPWPSALGWEVEEKGPGRVPMSHGQPTTSPLEGTVPTEVKATGVLKKGNGTAHNWRFPLQKRGLSQFLSRAPKRFTGGQSSEASPVTWSGKPVTLTHSHSTVMSRIQTSSRHHGHTVGGGSLHSGFIFVKQQNRLDFNLKLVFGYF
jgi:hypothetical protein